MRQARSPLIGPVEVPGRCYRAGSPTTDRHRPREKRCGFANRVSSPPPRVPFCLMTITVRLLAHLRGLGLCTVPDRSLPCASIVTAAWPARQRAQPQRPRPSRTAPSWPPAERAPHCFSRDTSGSKRPPRRVSVFPWGCCTRANVARRASRAGCALVGGGARPSGAPAERDCRAHLGRNGVSQHLIGGNPQRIVDGREREPHGYEHRDGEDLRVVETRVP